MCLPSFERGTALLLWKTSRALLRAAIPGRWAKLLLILSQVPWAKWSALYPGIVRAALSVGRRTVAFRHPVGPTCVNANEESRSDGHEHKPPEYHAAPSSLPLFYSPWLSRETLGSRMTWMPVKS